MFIFNVEMKSKHMCRLCLKVAKDAFQEVDMIIKHLLEALLLKLDLDVVIDPVICNDCVEMAKKYLNFKAACIDTEKLILAFSMGRKETKCDIKYIYKDRKQVVTVVNGDLDICRFCMTHSERNNFASLDTLGNEAVFRMLPEYMPEMDFALIENPIICTTCRKSLEGYFELVLNCLGVEQIKTFGKEKENDGQGHVNIRNVRDCLLPHKYHQLHKTNKELNTSKGTESVSHEAYNGLTKLKEELEIDEEKVEHTYMSVDMNISDLKMYKCSLCAYEAKQKRYLITHMLVHTDISKIKMHKCSLCAYEFKQRSHLTRHMLIHKDDSEIKFHKCSLCAYKAKRKSSLTLHMLVHKDVSEIKMFECSLCTYKAKHKGHLTSHMLVHKDVSEIKMHNCSICAYKTKYNSSLKAHMLVHMK